MMTFLLYVVFATDSDAPAQAHAIEQWLAQHGHNFTHPIPDILLIEAIPGTGAHDVADAIVPLLASGYRLLIAELTPNFIVI
jgi:hypothetical protein